MIARPVIIPIGPSIAYVPLTRGQFSLIDAEDAERVGCFNWCSYWNKRTESFYAVRYGNVRLHRFVLQVGINLIHDHVNGRTLYNRKANLRAATATQNAYNRRLRRDNASGLKGVSLEGRRYVSRIKIRGKSVRLGLYDTASAAHAAYCEAARNHHGEFARLA